VIALTAEEAGSALGLKRLAAGVPGVSIDSRSIRPGELFVALRGEHFDGHDFVAAALSAGASGAVVDESRWNERSQSLEALSLQRAGGLIYGVADTLAALGALGRAVRRKSGVIVVAITGSVGKTSTKDLVGAMAGKVRRVTITAANENNEVGVPLTLLRIEPATEIAVVEMGMRGRGQIAALAQVAEPDVGVVTNIHPAHLELLGTLEAVAEAKAELISSLTPIGVAVVPFDCRLLEPYVTAAGRRVVRFGLGEGTERAEVHGLARAAPGGTGEALLVRWPEGEAEVQLPFRSRHRLENAVAAAAACYAAGLPVERCLVGAAEAQFTGLRGEVQHRGGIWVINDSYNANPAAVRAALDDLVDLSARTGGRPVAVLGDMLELGREGGRYHREAGAYAAEAGVRALWGVGPHSGATVDGFRAAWETRQDQGAPSAPTAGHLFSAEEAETVVAGLLPGDVVLFKASRRVKLETLVERVVEAADAGAWDEPRDTKPDPDQTGRGRRS
jgi:UDP-N-acetylmuramoyl-tripeptide--D-alanyl-D-alanine ligase